MITDLCLLFLQGVALTLWRYVASDVCDNLFRHRERKLDESEQLELGLRSAGGLLGNPKLFDWIGGGFHLRKGTRSSHSDWACQARHKRSRRLSSVARLVKCDWDATSSLDPLPAQLARSPVRESWDPLPSG